MPRSEYTKFGEKVVLRLFMNGMTQADLAKKIGCSRQYLHKILCGERSGTKYTEMICSELDIEYSEEPNA